MDEQKFNKITINKKLTNKSANQPMHIYVKTTQTIDRDNQSNDKTRNLSVR